jgi:signal transduction histidine kinase
VLVTALLSWLSYDGVRTALEQEFARRLENVAATAASQVSPADIADARLLGDEGQGYGNLQVLLEALRSTAGVANVSILDSARVTLYDCRGAEYQREVSRLDTLARPALARALAGGAGVSRIYTADGVPLRAGFAPVPGPARRAVGVVAIEARPDYLPVLERFRRTLVLTAVVIALALALFSALLVRGAWAAAALERRLSRAENLATMGQLTATLAHEIKNPLAIIRGSAQRLGRLEPEAQRMAEFVVEESDRLSRTVARYLQFARGEEIPAETGDALATLNTTLDLLEGEFRERRVALERVGGAVEPAAVTLDNESLKQVYLNLILNALEAMPEGGRLAVATGERRGRFEVSIADTGAGIPPEMLKRLGSPFYTTKARGSGLGLFLARRLVRSAGGDLEIQSREGAGTTCTVRLPRGRG